MTAKKVTFIGLGVMGYPMAGHLINNNFEVTVFNRTRAKSDSWVKKYQGLAQPTPGMA
ncbi:MAG: oxidoreductase, partial [Pelagibacteraceae bacterium]|nr:oxidoreductase [Pelagibacteraceae bacterium]